MWHLIAIASVCAAPVAQFGLTAAPQFSGAGTFGLSPIQQQQIQAQQIQQQEAAILSQQQGFGAGGFGTGTLQGNVVGNSVPGPQLQSFPGQQPGLGQSQFQPIAGNTLTSPQFQPLTGTQGLGINGQIQGQQIQGQGSIGLGF